MISGNQAPWAALNPAALARAAAQLARVSGLASSASATTFSSESAVRRATSSGGKSSGTEVGSELRSPRGGGVQRVSERSAAGRVPEGPGSPGLQAVRAIRNAGVRRREGDEVVAAIRLMRSRLIKR